jgi:hypothetical protein
MGRTLDQIRASKLPSNMMQFAARGALSVPPAENIEILVYLARHNKVFGDLARMTLAGWDEKASMAAAADPQTPPEVLAYLISPDNLRPPLLPALLENSSVKEEQLTKLALSATRELIEMMLRSQRIRGCKTTLDVLKSNPYVKKEEAQEISGLLGGNPRESESTSAPEAGEHAAAAGEQTAAAADAPAVAAESVDPGASDVATGDVPEPEISAYLAEHAVEIAAEEGKPFQPIGGILDLLGADYFPVSEVADSGGTAPVSATKAATSSPVEPVAPVAPATAAGVPTKSQPPAPPRRENTMQKINRLDVKGRIQLALKGNKEERSILIRDGTKVVALAVLEAPKLADGEVEKFASQKNVLEAVLRQIPLKRRFMKNYIVVRNLVANPRTPLDLGLGLMKNLLVTDLKNLSNNKEVSETIRNLAMKMYKQKLDAAAKR